MFREKKAQITVFIIIGVLIIAAAGLLFLSRRPISEAEIEEVAENVPLELKPVQEFVTSCVYKVSKEALILIGQHGGYIDMSDEKMSKKKFNLKPSDPTESDAAYVTLDPSSHVAYWWSMKSENDCISCSVSDANRPSIRDIEAQLDYYIDKNLDACLNDFREFDKQGFGIKETNRPKATTTIAEKDVVVRLYLPLDIKIDDRSSNITNFITKLNIDFKHLYDFASALNNGLVDKFPIEQVMKHTISISSSPSVDRLPPLFSVESSYVPVTWSKTLVEKELQSLFTSYVSIIQVNRTKGASPLDFGSDKTTKSLYAPFFVDILNASYPKYTVRFIYLYWPLYFKITPSDGELIKPAQTIDTSVRLGPFTLPFPSPPRRYYQYYYDVSMPVIVEITSEEFFNETYTFYMGFEANLRDNKDLGEWFNGTGTFGEWDYSAFGLRPSKALRDSLKMQENMTTEKFKDIMNKSENPVKTLFCNEKQRISGNIEVKATNNANKSAIDGAEVLYACGIYDSCSMGITSKDNETGNISLKTKFPICVGGGILKVEKPGFRTETLIDISTLPKKDQKIEVKMEPVRKKSFTIKKFVIDRITINDSMANEIKFLVWNGKALDLEPYDMVMITLNKMNETPWEDSFSKMILFYGNDSNNNDYFRSIELVPGKYTIDAQYFYTNKTVLKANCSHYCGSCSSDMCERECRLNPEGYNRMPCGKCELDMWQPEEDINLDNQVLGGLEINSSSPWVVSASDLDNPNSRIEFHMVHAPLPRCIDDLSEFENVSSFYESRISNLIPKFI
jgi:hypothetical protein